MQRVCCFCPNRMMFDRVDVRSRLLLQSLIFAPSRGDAFVNTADVAD